MAGIEEIRKLTPEDRIKALKKVEEERKQEIEEAETLIRDSMREIKEASDKRHAPISQVKAHDISQLLTAEEKRMFKTARFEDSSEQPEDAEQRQMPNLEEVAEEESKNKDQQTHAPTYGKALDEARKGIDYSAKTTATGQRIEEKEGVQEIYSSKSVTGESDKPQEMYGKPGEPDSISGTYERRKDERKRREWE